MQQEQENCFKFPLDKYWDKGIGVLKSCIPVYNSYSQVTSYQTNHLHISVFIKQPYISAFFKSPLTGKIYFISERVPSNSEQAKVAQNQNKNLLAFYKELDEFTELVDNSNTMDQFDSALYMEDLIYFLTSMVCKQDREFCQSEVYHLKESLETQKYSNKEISISIIKLLSNIQQSQLIQQEILVLGNPTLPVYVSRIYLLGENYYIGPNLDLDLKDTIKAWKIQQYKQTQNYNQFQILYWMDQILDKTNDFEPINWIYQLLQTTYDKCIEINHKTMFAYNETIQLKNQFFISLDQQLNNPINQRQIASSFKFKFSKQQSQQLSSLKSINKQTKHQELVSKQLINV